MEVVMARNEILCIDGDARGLAIKTVSGQLWITQVGDGRDYLLAAGEQHTVSRKGRVALTACRASQVRFSTPVALRAAQANWQAELQTA